MACESKRISELPGVTKVYPNDLIPIVQDGTNKYITAKDLLGCHDHSGDDCCCSQALSKAITALDFSRTAMDLANKAYDKACQVGTKLAALEEKVAEHDTLICNIRSQITQIFNKFEELEGNLKVTIQLSIDDQNKKYKVLQGTREVETILVPRPTTDFENGDGRPADAAEVLRRLRNLKGEVSKNLNFVAGKFTQNGESYNGTTEKTLNIPTRTSHLINDGDPDGNPFLTGVKGYDGRTAPVTDGIADLSRIPIKLDDLNDVDAATPNAGDILYYDGTKWVNTPLQDLVESIIDCEYIQNCVSNFKVTPKTHNKTATETTAEYTVEATGAWTVAKESGDFITNFTPSGNGNGTITVTFGNNTTPNTRTAQFLVTETATGRQARVTINQSGVSPTGTHNVTYVVNGDASKITNLPNSPVTVTNGQSYTYTPTIEQGYEIPTNGVTFNPNGNGSYDGTTIIIPQGVTTDTTVTIKVVAEGQAILNVDPDTIIVPQGQTTDTNITVSTTCTGGEYKARNLPTGITAVKQAGGFKVTVQSSVSAGQYQFEVYDDCGNTHTVTVNVQASWLDNVTLGLSGNQFNALGVAEERFNANKVAITPGVSNPYEASTYGNNSKMYYDVDLGEAPGEYDLSYLEDHLYLKQVYVGGNEPYSGQSPQYRETKLSDFDSSYQQKLPGEGYRFPFTASITQDSTNDHIILHIGCIATDFNDSDSTIKTTTSSSSTTQEVIGSYITRDLYLELIEDGQVIDSTSSSLTNTFTREIYANKLFGGSPNACAGAILMRASSYTWPITSGYYESNFDSTTSYVSPGAAQQKNSSNNYPDYSYVVYEGASLSAITTDVTSTVNPTVNVNSTSATLEITNTTVGKYYRIEATTIPNAGPALVSTITLAAVNNDYKASFTSSTLNLANITPTYEYVKETWSSTSGEVQWPSALDQDRGIGPWWNTGVREKHEIILSDTSGVNDVSATYTNIFTGTTVSCSVDDLTSYSGEALQNKWNEIIGSKGYGCVPFIIKYHPSEAPSELRHDIFFQDPLGDVEVSVS